MSKKKIIIICAAVLCLIIAIVIILISINSKKELVNDQKNKKTECHELTGGSYNLIFETNGGNKIESMTICIACSPDSYKEVPTPTKEGDTFEGWYYDKSFENKVTEISTGEIKPEADNDKNGCLVGYKDITLYAKWSTTKTEVTTDNKKEENEDKKQSTKDKTAYCEDGSNPTNGKCTSIKVVDATVSYTCGNYQKAPSGDKCVGNVVAATSGSCPANSTYSIIADACIEKTSDDEATCSSKGGYIEGSTCIIEHALTGSGQLTCQAGMELVGETCYSYLPMTPIYTCSEGTLNGSKCNINVVTDAKYK